MFLERILNDNEKIRRAEEIYYRRNNRNISGARHEFKTQKTYLGSKILLEMLILILLATIVFAVKNKDYIFTQDFLNNFAQYNVNLTEQFNSIMAKFNEEEAEDVFINNKSSESEQNTTQETTTTISQENNAESVQTQSGEVIEKTSVVTDSQSLKSLVNFVKPLEGIVSSGFGARESQFQNVSGEHKGIDIAATSGSKIKSAMAGKVIEVSNKGDYGNHVKIQKDNVITLYAHCQEIFVTEGQEIVEGQEIASVGSTGNSTGPHLHFEIRINDIPINPAEIIQF